MGCQRQYPTTSPLGFGTRSARRLSSKLQAVVQGDGTNCRTLALKIMAASLSKTTALPPTLSRFRIIIQDHELEALLSSTSFAELQACLNASATA